MTHLRQIMTEELEPGNYVPGTIRAYIRTVEHFARHFSCRPDRLRPEHIRRYHAAMFRDWELAPSTDTQRAGRTALPLDPGFETRLECSRAPCPKKVLRLPEILSQRELRV